MHVRIYRTFPQLFQNRLEEPFNVMVCRVCKKTVGVSAVKKNTNAKAQAVQRESIFVLAFHLYF